MLQLSPYLSCPSCLCRQWCTRAREISFWLRLWRVEDSVPVYVALSKRDPCQVHSFCDDHAAFGSRGDCTVLEILSMVQSHLRHTSLLDSLPDAPFVQLSSKSNRLLNFAHRAGAGVAWFACSCEIFEKSLPQDYRIRHRCNLQIRRPSKILHIPIGFAHSFLAFRKIVEKSSIQGHIRSLLV